MSASANMQTGMTYALFHGCDDHDVKVLTDWLTMTTDSAGHPMLLPALFAELQLRRHKRLTRDNWSKLVTLYAHTGQYGHQASGQPVPLQDDPVDYDTTTRDVLGMYQDTGFLENSLLTSQRGLRRMAAQLTVVEKAVPPFRKDFILTEGGRIRERLEDMMDEYERLIAKCKLITDGASLLTGAVSRWSCLCTAHLNQRLTCCIGMESHSTTRQYCQSINCRRLS